MVWAGCLTCRHDPVMRKWIGQWVDADEFWDLTVYDVHPPGDVPDIDEHELHAYTLYDFGVPEEWSEYELSETTDYVNYLDGIGMLAPLATFAAVLGKDIGSVDYTEFRLRYYGQWIGKPTRAARKRFVFLSAGPGAWYMYRRQIEEPRSEAVRRGVQV